MTTKPGCEEENLWLRATDERRVRAMQIEKWTMPNCQNARTGGAHG
jgi:hypothetical protein